MYKRLKGGGNHARTVEITCKQHPKWQELLKMTGSFWSNTLSQLGRRDVKHKDKRTEVIKHFLELIQAGKVDEATLYLTNSATDLLACSAGYVRPNNMKALSEGDLAWRREDECRNTMLYILDEHLPNIYAKMLTLYYNKADATGYADEKMMRGQPWGELVSSFKKAYKIEAIEHGAKFKAAGTKATNPKPPTAAQHPERNPQHSTPYNTQTQQPPTNTPLPAACGKCILLGITCNPKAQHCKKPGHQVGLTEPNMQGIYQKTRGCEICRTGTRTKTTGLPPYQAAPVFYPNYPQPFGQSNRNNPRPPFPNNSRTHIFPPPPQPSTSTPLFNTHQNPP